MGNIIFENFTITSAANALASASVWVTPTKFLKAMNLMLWQAEQT
jgi:hypothetical protein